MSDENLPLQAFTATERIDSVSFVKSLETYTRRLEAVNKRIAVEPFPSRGVETKVRNAFATVVQKTSLVPLKVVFPSNGAIQLMEGQTVYVKGEAQAHQWAAEIFEVEGKKFILLPEDFVVLA